LLPRHFLLVAARRASRKSDELCLAETLDLECIPDDHKMRLTFARANPFRVLLVFTETKSLRHIGLAAIFFFLFASTAILSQTLMQSVFGWFSRLTMILIIMGFLFIVITLSLLSFTIIKQMGAKDLVLWWFRGVLVGVTLSFAGTVLIQFGRAWEFVSLTFFIIGALCMLGGIVAAPCFLAMIQSQLPPSRLGELTTAFQSLGLLVIGVVSAIITELFREDMIETGRCAEEDDVEATTDYIWPFLCSTICMYISCYLWFTWLDTYIPNDWKGQDSQDIGLQYDEVTGEPIFNMDVLQEDDDEPAPENIVQPKFA